MPFIVWPGHADPEQRRRFEDGRARSRKPLGTDPEIYCRAKLRNGGLCKQPKLRGHTRCLAHAGPAAAMAYRERQKRDFERGRVSAEEWARAEARRARNRVRNQWRRDPWTPGRTVDLGEHETWFQNDIAAAGFVLEEICPAVQDSARWKFRRFMLDRKSPGKWLGFLSMELPHKMLRSPPRPDDILIPGALENPAFLSAAPPRLAVYSKRRKPDRPTRSKAPVVKRQRGRPRKEKSIDEGSGDLAAIIARHAEELHEPLNLCGTEDERQRVIRAFASLAVEPDSQVALGRWREAIRGLREPF